MAELLNFDVDLEWSGTGEDGLGRLASQNVEIAYSAPESMGGRGEGASPEDLLVAAVSSCYSATLFGVLRRADLPAEHVRVAARGVVSGYPGAARFAELVVEPSVVGGDPARAEEYAAAAERAHDRCFIGKTIAGNVDYRVGRVFVLPSIGVAA
jgi:peroxiredoxin-like protein